MQLLRLPLLTPAKQEQALENFFNTPQCCLEELRGEHFRKVLTRDEARQPELLRFASTSSDNQRNQYGLGGRIVRVAL
eukprot:7935372-Karenia_brevis.AAC.1